MSKAIWEKVTSDDIKCLISNLLLSFSLSASNENLYKKLNTFGDVFETIRSNYVSEVDEEDVIEAAINGMLQSLDPHSGYMNLENYKEMQEQTDGKFGGLGIEVTSESGYVKIISPIDGTPGAKAGVQPGDYITHIADPRGILFHSKVSDCVINDSLYHLKCI